MGAKLMNSAIANLDIINACVPGYGSSRAIRVDPQGKVSQILSMRELARESKATQRLPKAKKKLLLDKQVLDVCGDYISLGGVDLQINGALGLAFTDLQAQDSELLSKIYSINSPNSRSPFRRALFKPRKTRRTPSRIPITTNY